MCITGTKIVAMILVGEYIVSVHDSQSIPNNAGGRMRERTREILDRIDEILLAGAKADWDDAEDDYGVAIELWNVLSALRGPDVKDGNEFDLKDTTTVHIRRAAFPKLAAWADRARRQYAGGMQIWSRKRFDFSSEDDSHFIDHVRVAAKVLGLIK